MTPHTYQLFFTSVTIAAARTFSWADAHDRSFYVTGVRAGDTLNLGAISVLLPSYIYGARPLRYVTLARSSPHVDGNEWSKARGFTFACL